MSCRVITLRPSGSGMRSAKTPLRASISHPASRYYGSWLLATSRAAKLSSSSVSFSTKCSTISSQSDGVSECTPREASSFWRIAAIMALTLMGLPSEKLIIKKINLK